MHALLRQRAAELELTREGIDDIVGLQSGYAGKVLGAKQTRKLGPATLGDFLEGLGVKLLAVVDEEAVDRHAGKVAANRARQPMRLPPAVPAERVEKIVAERLHAARVEAARRGAQGRVERQTPEQRSEQAGKAGRARWARQTPRQRKRAMAKLTEARRQKRQVRP